MATSLAQNRILERGASSEALRRIYEREISWAEEAIRGADLRDRVGFTEAKVWIDRDGTVSYRGRIVRTSDGAINQLPEAPKVIKPPEVLALERKRQEIQEAGGIARNLRRTPLKPPVSPSTEARVVSVRQTKPAAIKGGLTQATALPDKPPAPEPGPGDIGRFPVPTWKGPGPSQSTPNKPPLPKHGDPGRFKPPAFEGTGPVQSPPPPQSPIQAVSKLKLPPPPPSSPSMRAVPEAPRLSRLPSPEQLRTQEKAKGMGLFGGIIKGIGDVVTGIIPGTLDDKLFEAGKNLLGGGGGSPRLPTPVPAPRRNGGGQPGFVGPRGSGSVFEPSPIDLGPVEFDPFAMLERGRGGDGVPAQAGDFQQALMGMMLKKAMRGRGDGRAALEAMLSGSLQGGMIQNTVEVKTPRGLENHSPPGFRTVYIMGQPFAVFKPIAKTFGLLPKSSTCKISSADMKAISKADRLTKTLKRLGQKTGRLKITNK